MIEGFGTLITSRLAGPILGSVAVLALVGNGYQFISHKIEVNGLHDTIDSQGKQIDHLTRDNQTLRLNQGTLQFGLTAANASIDGLKQAAELADAKAKMSQANFNAAANVIDAQAAALGHLPTLPAGADHCAAASKLIRDTLAAEHGK